MLIADQVSIGTVLARLAARRSAFHSEADFQHAFAWEIADAASSVDVRLEVPMPGGIHVDVLARSDSGSTTVLEMKYLTAAWSGRSGSDLIQLKNHGAQDIRGYDVVLDIHRVERVVASGLARNGAVVCLTNDPSYWRPRTHGRATNAEAFRLHEGARLTGTHVWGPNTGAGTMRGRAEPIELLGSYGLAWRDYAAHSGGNGTFRALVVETGP